MLSVEVKLRSHYKKMHDPSDRELTQTTAQECSSLHTVYKCHKTSYPSYFTAFHLVANISPHPSEHNAVAYQDFISKTFAQFGYYGLPVYLYTMQVVFSQRR